MACIMYTAQLGKWIHEYFEDSINLDKLDNSTRAVDLQGKKDWMDISGWARYKNGIRDACSPVDISIHFQDLT